MWSSSVGVLSLSLIKLGESSPGVKSRLPTGRYSSGKLLVSGRPKSFLLLLPAVLILGLVRVF